MAVIHQHNSSHRQRSAYLDGGLHRNSNATMTLRRMRHGRIAVNRQAIAEVVGIVQQSQRRFSPAGYLCVDSKAACWRVGEATHSFFVVAFVAAGRDRKHSYDGAIIVSQQEYLPLEVHFHMTIT